MRCLPLNAWPCSITRATFADSAGCLCDITNAVVGWTCPGA
jgi:hypothetical protein